MMGKKRPTSDFVVAAGVAAVMLVALAVGMGIRKLRSKATVGVPEPSRDVQPTESERAVREANEQELSEQDEQFLLWVEQAMSDDTTEQEVRRVLVEPNRAEEEPDAAGGLPSATASQHGAAAQVLGGWRGVWADLNLTQDERARLAEGWQLAVARWQSMSQQERQSQMDRIRASWAKWQNMSEEEKEVASRELRRRFEAWRASGSVELPDMILD